MILRALLLTLSCILPAAHSEILFIDLNNADGEVAACENNAPGEVNVISKSTLNVPKINKEVIEGEIAELERQGRSIDTLVISGHDGSGHFFGGRRDENEFFAGDLDKILEKHGRFRRDLKILALHGCYTANVDAKQRFWFNPKSNIQFAVGFPLQAPDKSNQTSQNMLGQFCAPERRAEALRASSRDELCEFYENMPLLQTLNASVCNREALATNLYGNNICYSDSELFNRCGEFDKGNNLYNEYTKYFVGKDPGYENPPSDSGDAYTSSKNKSVLRRYYNQVHLWNHCLEDLGAERGYQVPMPTEIVRLIFFDNLRNNINRLNRTQLEDYDSRLAALGLGDLALGDISTSGALTRGDIVRRLDSAVADLDQMRKRGEAVQDPSTGEITEAKVVYQMAVMLKLTLVDLQFKRYNKAIKDDVLCSHFTLVHPRANIPSRCVVSYRQAMNVHEP